MVIRMYIYICVCVCVCVSRRIVCKRVCYVCYGWAGVEVSRCPSVSLLAWRVGLGVVRGDCVVAWEEEDEAVVAIFAF